VSADGTACVKRSSVPCGATAWPYRYELLDGLRGIAALVVVMHHSGLAEVGHFAVMVFFVISGYCITASAESCRDRGLGFKVFMQRRIRRIYPPYLFALLFFAVTRGVKTLMGGHNDLARTAVEWLQNITLTQWLTLLVQPKPWPTQNPTLFVAAFWSLNYEEQFYLVIALCLLLAARKRMPMVVPVIGLMAVGLAFNVARPGDWVCGLFLEYWAHFALGSLLFFVLCKYTTWRVRALFVAALLSLGVSLTACLLPWAPERLETQRAFVELLLLVTLTLGLLVLRPRSSALARSPFWRPIAALGSISYSLYLIHQFNLTFINSATHLVLPVGAPQALHGVLAVALHVALASAFWYCCERPFIRTGAAVSIARAPVETPGIDPVISSAGEV
jgi:peptidoglycan/LPS O-acetylase OafA/YrhL